MDTADIVIRFPVDGAVLNKHHGNETREKLKITVKGETSANAEININGVKTFAAQGELNAAIELKETHNVIKINSISGCKNISVVWDRRSFRRYYFFIDDNNFFFTEIYKKSFKSIFDSFYLARLREFHKRYGAKFVLNVFFRNDHEPFDLSQFPSRYKAEWEANSDWLKLAFHAYSEFPGHPYSEHFPDKLPDHFEQVKEQVVRFAGEKTFCPPCVIHFYAVNSRVSLRFLRANGVTALAVRNFPPEAEAALTNVLYERENDLFRMPVDLICNLHGAAEIQDILRKCVAKPWKDTINIGTHEQYCYPYYSNYIPDHFERMETALKIVTENGYKPVFFHEGLLGNRAN